VGFFGVFWEVLAPERTIRIPKSASPIYGGASQNGAGARNIVCPILNGRSKSAIFRKDLPAGALRIGRSMVKAEKESGPKIFRPSARGHNRWFSSLKTIRETRGGDCLGGDLNIHRNVHARQFRRENFDPAIAARTGRPWFSCETDRTRM
jgi:hypothetical protein